MTTEDSELSATKCRKITVEEQQQEFCSYFGFRSKTIWDEYDSDINSDAKSLLSRKINLIFGDEIDETNESDGITVSEISIQLNKSSKMERFRKMKENLVEAIWKQRKYNNGTLLMSPIFVALVAENEQYAANLMLCKQSLSYSLHPVFRIIKCRRRPIKLKMSKVRKASKKRIRRKNTVITENANSSTENGNTNKCCMIFVDEHARVYQNWMDFKEHNEYPPGYLVAPTLGVYNTVDSKNLNRVQLEIFSSPSTKSSSKLAAKADKISTVGGLAAAGVTAATIVSIPMLPIVAAGALVTGISCAAYTAGRSAFKLADRSKHEQTIKLSDTKARSHWLGFASGAFGFGTGGAVVSQVGQVVAGSASTILNGAAMLMNGVGTLDGVYAIFLKKHDYENISSLEMHQFSSSLFIFTHSVYNRQTADSIPRSCSKTTIGEFRRALSRSQQDAFDKLVNKTQHQKGSHQDVIRSLRSIRDANHGELSENVAKISIQSDKETVNDAQATNSVTEDDPAATTITMSPRLPNYHVVRAIEDLIELEIFVRNNKDLESLMTELVEEVSNIHVFDLFIDFMRSYFTQNCRCISDILDEKVAFECVFETAMNIIRNLAKSSGVDFEEYIENTDSQYLRSKINEFYNRQRIHHELRGQPTEHCKICFGTYYVEKKESV